MMLYEWIMTIGLLCALVMIAINVSHILSLERAMKIMTNQIILNEEFATDMAARLLGLEHQTNEMIGSDEYTNQHDNWQESELKRL